MLEVLAGTVFLTLVLGAIPALRMLWVLALVAGIATVAYVGLLAHFAREARAMAARAELAEKVVPLRLVADVPASSDERLVATAGMRVLGGVGARPMPAPNAAFVIVETP